MRPRVGRANLDGTGVETVVTGSEASRGLPLGGGKMYWTEYGRAGTGSGQIHRADLDGANVESLVTGLDVPAGIALDIGNGKIYCTDDGTKDKIQRSNLDGSNVEDLVTTGLKNPDSIKLNTSD